MPNPMLLIAAFAAVLDRETPATARAGQRFVTGRVEPREMRAVSAATLLESAARLRRAAVQASCALRVGHSVPP